MKDFAPIVQRIMENALAATDEELAEQFQFFADEQGWSDEEIKAALASPWFPSLHTGAVVLQPIHLGTGEEGIRRRKALLALAAEAGHSWGGQTSIGRWLVALADERLAGN